MKGALGAGPLTSACRGLIAPVGSGFGLEAVRFGLMIVLAGALGCARAMAPPGGERDVTPPAVVEMRPEPGATIGATDEPAVIVFDERISERNIRDAVYVSPVTGAPDVSKGWSDIEVRLAGGWQAGRVYRIVIRPVVLDLFNNTIRRPIEFAFSTGAPFSDAAIAGVVYERVTGSPVADARVEARPIEGGAYHLAIADTGGIFRLPLLPPGDYLLRGYVDQNRDRRRDAFEPGDSMTVQLGQADTLLRPLAVMRSDTSAANLTRVEVVDSLTLRLEFDDYMDVTLPQRAGARVLLLPDSLPVSVTGVHYPHVYEAVVARRDSLARDSAAAAALAADTLAVDSLAADTLAAIPAPALDTAEAPRAAAPADSVAVDTIPPDPLIVLVREAALRPSGADQLPVRALIVELAAPLVPEAQYVVRVGGVTNLAGIDGGGGTREFSAPALPPPPEEAAPEAVETVQPDDAPAAEDEEAEPTDDVPAAEDEEAEPTDDQPPAEDEEAEPTDDPPPAEGGAGPVEAS